jgi:hypothetical protein
MSRTRVLAIGRCGPDGVELRCGGDGYMPVAQVTPLGRDVAALVVTFNPQTVEGEFVPCRFCGKEICECPDWIEFMTTDPMRCQLCGGVDCTCVQDMAAMREADPHGDVSWRESVEVTY